MTQTTVNLKDIAVNAKNASLVMASLPTEIKDQALETIANSIENNKQLILNENQKDLDNAKVLVEKGEITQAIYNRLILNDSKMKDMVQGIRDIIKLNDPVNQKQWAMELDKNLDLYKVSCPIGVIGVIFESRPDVVPQIAALAIKSSNAVILKGGSEANFSNQILADIINRALLNVDKFPSNSINLIKTREDVAQMLEMNEYIDLIIPRGGNNLVKYIQSNTKIPVLGHADGICHIYVDETADAQKAIDICVDSKIQYPSACNAVETILINSNASQNLLPQITEKLKENEVLIKGDNATMQIINDIEATTEEDWKTEYGDKIVSVKIVKNLQEAIEHINKYGSGHTDCIITESKENAEEFMNLVDSAGVYWNASTRFADGFRYGFGAEVGISTNKTHARGPVGLDGLIIYKYKMYGNGQIVADYSGINSKTFTHNRII